MNTYNDNLHAGVVDSLQNLDQDLKKINSQANAAMFTLYYAEGATITARNKLDSAKSKQSFVELVKGQAVKNSNISNNLLASATQANQYLKQSATNMAIAASNVQIAANAIVRLSSDIGSISNIVQAADFDSEISDMADQTNHYIKRTAYDAEVASQSAMDASVATAKISASTVEDKSKATNKLMNDLLKVLSDSYDAVSQKVSDSNVALAAASADEKKSEGVYEDLDVVRNATNSAYGLANSELNLGLSVTFPKDPDRTTFKVSFNFIRSPFREKDKDSHYPVKDYYLFLVKDKQRSNFTLNNAENIILNTDSNRFIHLQTERPKFHKHPHTPFSDELNWLDIHGKKGNFQLKDSDGELIAKGVNYAVFLLATYEEDYKRKLNSFDDFLSAPSSLFSFTDKLEVAKFTTASSTLKLDDPKEPAVVNFSVAENPSIVDQVEYRCIFLPMNEIGSSTDMANANSIKELEKRIDELRKESTKWGGDIHTLENKQVSLFEKIEELKKKHKALSQHVESEFLKQKDILESRIEQDPEAVAKSFMHIIKTGSAKDGKMTAEENEAGVEFVTALLDIDRQAKQLVTLYSRKDNVTKKILSAVASKIGFIFNLDIAQQVSASNYTVAKKVVAESSVKSKKTENGHAHPESNWKVSIDNSTTDNFGNLLQKKSDGDKTYIPVILSVSSAADTELATFTNVWTGYEHSPLLKFI